MFAVVADNSALSIPSSKFYTHKSINHSSTDSRLAVITLDATHIGELKGEELRALVRDLQQYMTRLNLANRKVQLRGEQVVLSWSIASKTLKEHMTQRTFVLLKLTEELERLGLSHQH